MFSLDKFYNIIHTNLIAPVTTPNDAISFYFTEFGTYNSHNLLGTKFNNLHDQPLIYGRRVFHCYFFDQEPFFENTKKFLDTFITTRNPSQRLDKILILANSEKSEFVDQIVESQNFYNWYYFFHGFAALDWFRSFQYIPSTYFNRFDKVFICYNHLISEYRSYRLHLVSNLINENLTHQGYTSLSLSDSQGSWKTTLADPNNPLDKRARLSAHNVLKNLNEPLVIDTANPNGTLSADINFDYSIDALWHIVSETIYFQPKLHLTEKIFKPIVCKRPFILVGAPGNLEYLKSYGFQTFNRWIDESYDQEEDHYLRIELITKEIKKLCSLSKTELETMHQEMQEVLEYNFNHFYGGAFKKILVDELVDNYKTILDQHQIKQLADTSQTYPTYQLSAEYLEQVKNRLLQ